MWYKNLISEKFKQGRISGKITRNQCLKDFEEG